MKKEKILYYWAAFGSFVGIIAAFWQTLDKLELLKNPNAVLTCNVNSVFSCTNILNSWQSSVFGFPNSIMCLIFFVFFFAMALAGILGSKLSRSVRLTTQGLALFMTGFGLWYMTEAIYVVGSVCLFCLFCFGGLLIANAAWFRINNQEMKRIRILRVKGIDIFIWVILAIYLAASIIFKLY